MTPTDSSSGSLWVPPTPEDLHSLLPQLEVTEIVGRGGMGAVYKGRQPHLNRNVAIKVLPAELGNGDSLNYGARFKQEAQAMAALDHPAIVSVFDFGVTSDGQMYFVMEYVDGMDVEEYIKQHGGRISPETALAITSHVLDALDYAHKSGVVHRDIKPANVLLNQAGRVKIADFGLAKIFENQNESDLSGLTMSNIAVGTPDFVAPEALDGDSIPDHRGDLYAVGVMLYKMLTGNLPRGHYKHPSEVIDAIDPRLDDIVSKAMQPEPDDRYADAIAVRMDIDRVLNVPLPHIEASDHSGQVDAAVPLTTTFREKESTQRDSAGVQQRRPLIRKAMVCSALFAAVVAASWWYFEKDDIDVPAAVESSAKDAVKAIETEDAGAKPPKELVKLSELAQGKSAARAAVVMVEEEQAAMAPTHTSSALQTVQIIANPEDSAEEIEKGEMEPSQTGPAPSGRAEEQIESEVVAAPVWEIDVFTTRMQGYLEAFEDEMSGLAYQYVSGVEQRLDRFAASGDLALVKAYRDERDRVTRFQETIEENLTLPLFLRFEKQPVLEPLDDQSPDALKKLRSVWSGERSRIEGELNGKLRQSLRGAESFLTKSRSFSEAELVEAFRMSTVPDSVALNSEPQNPLREDELSKEEELLKWLQNREFRWDATSVDEIVMQFSGDEVTVYADGREIMERELEILSPHSFRFQWLNGGPNTFTVSSNRKDFVRGQANGTSHPGKISVRSKL